MDLNIKKCLVNTKNGQLKDTLNILNGISDLLTSEDALKIIVVLCNTSLNEKCLVQFTPNDMSDLLFVCTKEIKNLDSRSMNSFLASIFYIIKYFLNMDYYNFVYRFENDFISILHNNITDIKLITLVGNISKLIYNRILLKHACMKSSDLLILSIFSIKILLEIKKLDDLLKEEISVYFTNFNLMQLHSESKRDIYLFIVRLVEKEINEELGLAYFQSTMSLLNVIGYTHFVDDGEFDKGKDLVFETTRVFKKIKNLENVSIIMENIVSIICTEEKFPSNIKTVLQQIQTSFSKIYHENRDLPLMSNFSKFLGVVVITAKKIFREFSNEFWRSFSVESQIILSKFTAHLSLSISSTKLKCRTCENCDLDYDLISAISISGTPAYILKYWLSNNNNNNDNTNNKARNKLDELSNHVRKSLDLCCTWIQELHKRKCNSWIGKWTEVGATIYNLSITLYHNKYIQATLYTKYFIKKLILFEGIKDSVIKENILNVVLSTLAESYIHAKDNVRAMLIYAFNIFLHPERRDQLFLQWVRIKSNEKDDTNLQNFNLVSIMTKYRDTLVDFCPTFNMSTEDQKELLLFELRQYNKVWASKLSIMTTFKEICQYNDVLLTAQGIILSWGEAVSILPCEIYDIVFKTVSEFETLVKNENNVRNNISMAFLYLVQYHVSCVKLQQQNMQDMKGKAQIKTTGNQDRNDKNYEGDVIASYETLKLDVHSKIMKYLKKSLNAFKKQIKRDKLQELKEMNVYAAMVKIGNEFLLHSYSLEYIDVWLLCYHLGKLLKDNICVIESIGNLCEVSNMNSDFIKSALFEVHSLVLEVNTDETYKEGENAIRKWIVLTNFYISLGLARLAHSDVDNALNAFRTSKEYYYSQSYNKKMSDLLKVKLDFFEWRLQLLPCSYQVENHSSVLSKTFFLIEGISQCFKTDGYNAYVIHLLFQIFCSILHMYRWLRQPREVSCYGKQILHIAHQLVVPLTCVKILSYLADADLLSNRTNDCRYKVNSICDILGHSRNKIITTHSNDASKKSIPSDDVISSITNTLQEMVLDFPSTKPRFQESSFGSPMLLKDSFKAPSFVEHIDACKCFFCLSVDYQHLVMIHVNLQASLCYAQENFEETIEYYEGAIYIYKHLLNKQAYFYKKVGRILQTMVMPTIENTFRETYCIILLGLSHTLITSDKFMDINTSLIEILKKNPLLNYHLYNEAVLQKINYLSMKTFDAEKESHSKHRCLSPPIDEYVEIPTTPESKCSEVTVPLSPSPVTRPSKRTVKLIKFDIPDDDNKEQNVASTPLSPLLSFGKTPALATSKIKVYLPTPAKSTRKKKVTETLEFPSDHNEEANVNVDPPKSSKKMDTKLKSMTKLLTEKLKNIPDVPKIVVTNEMAQECTKPDKNRPRTRARRNLMSKIESDSGNNENNDFTNCASSSNSNTDTSGKGAVKKRTRSNKNV